MKTIHFRISGQSMEVDHADIIDIVKGSVNYLTGEFECGPEWNNYKAVAEFVPEDGKSDYQKVADGKCAFPASVSNSGKFSIRLIGVNGDDKIMTNNIWIFQKE